MTVPNTNHETTLCMGRINELPLFTTIVDIAATKLSAMTRTEFLCGFELSIMQIATNAAVGRERGDPLDATAPETKTAIEATRTIAFLAFRLNVTSHPFQILRHR
jgi:hypothetical protein